MIDIEKMKPKLEEKDIVFFMDRMHFTVTGAMKMMNCKRNKISDYIADGTLEVLRLASGDAFSPESIENWGLLHTLNGKGKMAKKKVKK